MAVDQGAVEVKEEKPRIIVQLHRAGNGLPAQAIISEPLTFPPYLTEGVLVTLDALEAWLLARKDRKLYMKA
jgi:hypothetical protein